jgi:hypothetical protein
MAGGRMNRITITAFFDEMYKIKEASMLRNVGSGLLNFGKKVGNNVSNTVKGFGSPIDSMKAGLQDATAGATTGRRVFNTGMMGLGAAITLPEAVSAEDPSGEGRSRVERMSGWVGDQAGSLIGSPHGWVSGQLVGGMSGRLVGSTVGKAVDKVRGYEPPKPPQIG